MRLKTVAGQILGEPKIFDIIKYTKIDDFGLKKEVVSTVLNKSKGSIKQEMKQPISKFKSIDSISLSSIKDISLWSFDKRKNLIRERQKKDRASRIERRELDRQQRIKEDEILRDQFLIEQAVAGSSDQ